MPNALLVIFSFPDDATFEAATFRFQEVMKTVSFYVKFECEEESIIPHEQ